MIVYSIIKPDFTIEYRFDKEDAERLRALLKQDSRKGFSVGSRGRRLWYALMVLAKEQGTGTGGTVSIRDIARVLGMERIVFCDFRQPKRPAI